MKQRITRLLDLFYPPFRKIMPLQTFRYAACGAINTFLGLLIYFIGYQYIFLEEVFNFGFYAFERHIAALFLSCFFSFVFGFVLNKYVVFTSSYLKGRIQLFRYFLSFALNLVINYLLLKLMVEFLGWNALISQLCTTLIVILVSFLSQRHFTFKTR